MKHANDIETMLFDYIEGNLTKKSASKFENQLTSDLILQQELTLWKSTQLDYEYYDTANLESKIINKTFSFNTSYYLNILLIVSLIFISNIPSENNTPKALTIKEMNRDVTHTIQGVSNSDQSTKKADFNKKVKTKKLKHEIVLIPKETKRKPYHTHKVERKILPSYHSPYIEKVVIHIPNEIKIQSQNIKEEENTKKSIKKMKRKAKRNRIATKFIKGDQLYVVPMNTQNF